MTYQAFYRVYRPQSFREMSGQTHVKRTLQNALLAGKTTHAYLFSGPRGTGKTSTARIFAKALNCEQAPTSEPCNECPSCKAIEKGSNVEMDVFEFDAASNSRVEEMREVLEKVKVAPQNSKYKVYIIDEVHMLSTSAFNALLKTLEEPPPHVVFILATTEPHKLPATIISRCQRFDFKRLSSQDILDRMKVVLEDINLPYDEQALKVIAQASAGGMRDALSLLDQVVSFSGERLELEDTLLVTGTVGQDVFYNVTNAIEQKNVAEVLTLLEQLIADGKEPLRLAEDFITFFRDLLLLQTDRELADLLEFVSVEEKFVELAHRISADTLYGYIDILAKTQQEMRFSHHTKIYLETALIKMTQLTAGHTAGGSIQAQIDPAIMDKVATLESMVRQLSAQLQASNMPTQQREQAPKQAQKRVKTFQAPVGRIKEVLKDATKQDIHNVKSAWAKGLSQLAKTQSALFADAEPVAASNSAFVVKFKYAIHCEMVYENKALVAMFTQALAADLGAVYELLCIPDEDWTTVREQFIKEQGLLANKEEKESSAPPEQLFIEEEADNPSNDPLVSKAGELFGNDFAELED